ncbi:MAG: MFS transporter [Candidatus Sumerlaeia bacterium]|nr:MFS transporter [Candidatus Sumerlaeia bacterium]
MPPTAEDTTDIRNASTTAHLPFPRGAPHPAWRRLSGLVTGADRKHPMTSRQRDALAVLSIEGFLSSIYLILTTSAFLSAFALMLGASDMHMALITSIPSVSNILGLVGAAIAERLGTRRLLTVVTSALSRLLWIPICLLPFLPLDPREALHLFLLLIVISGLMQGVSTNVFQGWIADLVPESLRGRYMGRRNRIINVGSIIAMLAGGAVLDLARDNGAEAFGFAAVFLVAVVFGLGSVEAIRREWEPPMERVAQRGFLRNATRPFRDPDFRGLIACFALLHFSLGFSAPFFFPYLIKDVGVSNTQLASFVVTSLAIGAVFHGIWGPVMDRAGIRPALSINVATIAFIPFLYVASLSGGLFFVYLAWILAGISWSGFSIASMNLPFALSPREGRSYYLAALNIVMGLMFLAGAWISGVMAERIAGWRGEFLGVQFVHYHVLFVISALGRFGSMLLFRRVRDVKNRGLLLTLMYAGELIYLKAAAMPYVGGALKKRPG